MKDHISDSAAIKIAQDAFKRLRKGSSFFNNRRGDKILGKQLLPLINTLIDDGLKRFTSELNSAKTEKEKKFYRELIKKFSRDKQIFLQAKPVRYSMGVPIYPGKIYRLIYGLYSSGIGLEHPHELVRANYILHNLRPDLFDETGRNIKTGEYVDFTLKGQIARTLKRAKTVGKRQYKVTVGRLKRALGKFGNAVKEKISGWIPTQAQPAAVSESYYYNFLNLNQRSVIFP